MKTKAAIFPFSRAFSIVEVLVAVAALALLGTGAIAGLLAINRTVVTNRLATNAQAIAQSRIDRILGEPYPEGGAAPAELTVGTTAQTNVPIYSDPATGALIVAGTVTTTINDVTRTIVAGAPAPKLLQAIVAVSYSYGGKPASVILTTVRTVD